MKKEEPVLTTSIPSVAKFILAFRVAKESGRIHSARREKSRMRLENYALCYRHNAQSPCCSPKEKKTTSGALLDRLNRLNIENEDLRAQLRTARVLIKTLRVGMEKPEDSVVEKQTTALWSKEQPPPEHAAKEDTPRPTARTLALEDRETFCFVDYPPMQT